MVAVGQAPRPPRQYKCYILRTDAGFCLILKVCAISCNTKQQPTPPGKKTVLLAYVAPLNRCIYQNDKVAPTVPYIYRPKLQRALHDSRPTMRAANTQQWGDTRRIRCQPSKRVGHRGLSPCPRCLRSSKACVLTASIRRFNWGSLLSVRVHESERHIKPP